MISEPFARHPYEPDRFIGRDGAMTFYRIYQEKNNQSSEPILGFEDWVAAHLNTNLD